MDLLENCFHVRFIAKAGAISSRMTAISASVANIKWALANISIIIGVAFLVKKPKRIAKS